MMLMSIEEDNGEENLHGLLSSACGQKVYTFQRVSSRNDKAE